MPSSRRHAAHLPPFIFAQVEAALVRRVLAHATPLAIHVHHFQFAGACDLLVIV